MNPRRRYPSGKARNCYNIVRGLKEKGTSIILISHRFEDIFHWPTG